MSSAELHHTRPSVWPSVREGRFAKLIQTHSPAECRVALLGLPDDTGVRLNHGRPGAKDGPQAFRQALANFGTSWDGLQQTRLMTRLYDAGDVQPAPGKDEAALLQTHQRVAATVHELCRLGLVTVCIGGGHDLSLPSLRTVGEHYGAALGGINLDAHLDVRTRVGSGMPFRSLIQAGSLNPARFVELGLGRFANDEADLSWLRELGARLIYAHDIQLSGFDPQRELEFALGEGAGFLSIDLDGLDQSVAPGVSAPNPLGLSLWHAALLAERAGASQGLLHFDLMELNPTYDQDGRTARAAALIFLHFMAGFQRRAI